MSSWLALGEFLKKKQIKTAMGAAWIIGLLIHLPIMVSDIPNHDGLASMYFDQNMITSGRWFLSAACALSSYYALPWLIGLLSVFWLGLVSAALTVYLDVRRPLAAGIIGGLTVSFPVLASNFAYVFTMDGYMLGLLLAVLAVLAAEKSSWGFVWGGICLSFSLGIYQSYLPIAMILALYGILRQAFVPGSSSVGRRLGAAALRYALMGIIGVVLYTIILRVLLWIQGKELATYQGISGVGTGTKGSLRELLIRLYRDFFTFSIAGKIMVPNLLAGLSMLCLIVGAGYVLIRQMLVKKWWKKLSFYGILLGTAVVLPICSNVILILSPQVSYHLLMRYQWVLFPILLFAFGVRYGYGRFRKIGTWLLPMAGVVLIFCYGVVDNIAYSNLEKRYEKTYAYCLRLLDRMEQTEGYYQGIPVAMVGVVGEDSYPLTDITGSVTDNMVGIHGDSLLYTSENYRAFFQYYLGATLNFLPVEEMGKIYESQPYREMNSFPGKDSVKIVDGILYVKTENKE
jgi:hypothetical protein